MFAVSGFGSRKAAAGGGKRIAIATSGMAHPGIIRRVRLNRRIAGGGRFPVRQAVVVAARRRPLRLTIAGAASKGSSFFSRRKKSKPRVANVTVPLKWRRRIASPAGAVLAIA